MVLHRQPNIMNNEMNCNFDKRIKWGENVTFGTHCRDVSIGFGGVIGDDIYIDVEEFHVGDYFTIHHGSVIHGKKCVIGHNVWVGHYCILDALGGLLKLGNNVGIGAHSQLWSHMKFGDRLAGCRWYNMNELIVGDSAWFVGHCLVSPIVVEPKAMLMLGGVAVKDMAENHIYSGSPAKDVTSKMGHQFREITLEEKKKMFSKYVDEYSKQGNDVSFIKTTNDLNGITRRGALKYTYFDLQRQFYLPRYTEDEYKFIRFLLYDKAKFIPIVA